MTVRYRKITISLPGNLLDYADHLTGSPNDPNVAYRIGADEHQRDLAGLECE